MPDAKTYKYGEITIEKLDRFFDLLISDYHNYEYWGRDLIKEVISDLPEHYKIAIFITLLTKLEDREFSQDSNLTWGEKFLNKAFFRFFLEATFINFDLKHEDIPSLLDDDFLSKVHIDRWASIHRYISMKDLKTKLYKHSNDKFIKMLYEYK